MLQFTFNEFLTQSTFKMKYQSFIKSDRIQLNFKIQVDSLAFQSFVRTFCTIIRMRRPHFIECVLYKKEDKWTIFDNEKLLVQFIKKA